MVLQLVRVLAADIVREDAFDDGVAEVVRLWVCSVAKLVLEEKDNFSCTVGAGVQVESLLRGVLLRADVNDMIGLFSFSSAEKNWWCGGHRSTPGPSSVPPGAHSHVPWHTWWTGLVQLGSRQ